MIKEGLIVLNLLTGLLAPSVLSSANLLNSYSELDKSSVSDDLNNPMYDLEEIISSKSIQFIDFYEYCFGNESNYELLIYIYLPKDFNIISNSPLNKIQISFGSSSYYQKLNLKLLSNDDTLYKFKIDLNDNNKDYLFKIFGSKNRIYKISGIELQKKGDRNANEFKVGGEYSYSGYAKGINEESIIEPTLKRDVVNLETLDLDVNSTYYRFHDNYGDFKQKDLNSVYFSIPNYYLEKYGEVSNINFEYYEHRLADIVVIKSNVYEALKDYVGVKTTKENHPEFALVFDYSGQISTNTEYYTFEGTGFEGSNLFLPFEKNNLITILFDGGVNGDKEISSEEILNYINNYDSSYFNGTNYKGLSNDLFDGVDENHKQGYNNVNISSIDNENLLIYEGNSSWNRFWNMIFGNNNEINVPLIEKVESNKTSEEIYINGNDIDEFNDFVDLSNNNDKSTYLLRYSLTDYYVYGLRDYRYGDISSIGRDGYVAKQSIFLDFDIISFTFEKEGIEKIIPAVSNPIDIVSDTTKPEDPGRDFLTSLINFIKVVCGIVLVVIIVLLLNLVFNLLGISFKDIINFLFVKPFKWIGSKFKGKKKNKKVNKKK